MLPPFTAVTAPPLPTIPLPLLIAPTTSLSSRRKLL
jgi:hypothetical protein